MSDLGSALMYVCVIEPWTVTCLALQGSVRLQEAAKDVIAQEAIADEVKKFMAKSGSMQEDDLLQLEETIRLRLSGRTPPCAPAALAACL